MRNRMMKKIKKVIRTARDASTHWYKGTDIMRVHQGQLNWDWTSTWSNQILWMWLARSLFEKPLTMTLGLASSAYTGFWRSSLFGLSPSLDLEGGGRNLNFPQGRKSWLLLGMEREEEREWEEWEGVGRRGWNGSFYNLIKKRKNNRHTQKRELCSFTKSKWQLY